MIARRVCLLTLVVFIAALIFACPVFADTGAAVQRRIAADVDSGRPLVVHVTVVLSDAKNGTPEVSPWWGGPDGFKMVFLQKSGWKLVSTLRPDQPGIYERIILTRNLIREGREAKVYLVADAWMESSIQKALVNFFAHARGALPETLALPGLNLRAGGDSVISAYMGRNGMEDIEPIPDDTYAITPEEEWLRRAAARPDAAFEIRPKEQKDRPISAVVICAYSKAYFLDKLNKEGAHPLLLTTANDRPEAHGLSAAITAWVGNMSGAQVRNAVAEAFSKATGASKEQARLKFWSGE